VRWLNRPRSSGRRTPVTRFASSASSSTHKPAMRISPSSGRNCPVRTLSRVDLPTPFGPKSANSPQRPRNPHSPPRRILQSVLYRRGSRSSLLRHRCTLPNLNDPAGTTKGSVDVGRWMNREHDWHCFTRQLSSRSMNKNWHAANTLATNVTLQQRVSCHSEHLKYCACRDVPKSLSPYFEPEKTGEERPLRWILEPSQLVKHPYRLGP